MTEESPVYYNESSGIALAAHTTWTYVAIRLCEGYNNEYTYWRDVALETCTLPLFPAVVHPTTLHGHS